MWPRGGGPGGGTHPGRGQHQPPPADPSRLVSSLANPGWLQHHGRGARSSGRLGAMAGVGPRSAGPLRRRGLLREEAILLLSSRLGLRRHFETFSFFSIRGMSLWSRPLPVTGGAREPIGGEMLPPGGPPLLIGRCVNRYLSLIRSVTSGIEFNHF